MIHRNKEQLHIDRLQFNYYYDPRRGTSNVYACEYLEDGSIHNYSLVKEEIPPGVIADKPLIQLLGGFNGEQDIKDFLQKIVDFAYDNFQTTPSKYTLESSSQAAHLSDMRKIVSKELEVDLD